MPRYIKTFVQIEKFVTNADSNMPATFGWYKYYRSNLFGLCKATYETLKPQHGLVMFTLYGTCRAIVIRYREQYGNLYTIFELTALPGFRKSRVLKIAPYLSLETGSPERAKQKTKMCDAPSGLSVNTHRFTWGVAPG